MNPAPPVTNSFTGSDGNRGGVPCSPHDAMWLAIVAGLDTVAPPAESPPAFDGSHPRAAEISALIDDQFQGRRRPTLRVHADDDMFKFAWDSTSTTQLAVFSYFRAGIQIFETAREIVEWRFGSFEKLDSFCDFAAGYGRSTRFLAAAMDPDRIWAAEILP